MSSSVTATFVFTDLVDSTAIAARLGPEAAEELRQTHFGLLRGAVRSAGGIEVKSLGDGLMVMFTSLGRALACAVAMQQSIDRHNRRGDQEPLSVRIGISTGDATEDGGDYYGDCVVEAARLCAYAHGDQILATDTVRVMVGRHAPAELVPVGELDLKGIPDPVASVEVRWSAESGASAFPLPARLSAGPGGGVFTFTGRVDELRQLEDVRKRAGVDGLQLALIAAEPGMGKTALAGEAARRAHDDGAGVLFGGCFERVGVPYQPWIGVLSSLISHASSAVVEGLRPAQAGVLRTLVPKVSDRLPGGEAIQADAETERFVLFDAVADLLDRAASDVPIVVVLDDLHWADAATLDLLSHLVGSAGSSRVSILATYRDSELSRAHPLSSLLAEWRRVPSVTRLTLAGLGDTEVVELMQSAAGHELPPEGVELAHTLQHETGGNPFFAVELLRNLAETGALTLGADGRYALAAGADDLSLPSSVREVVTDRVARLGSDTVDVLSAAAVIGQEFDTELLAAVARVDDDALVEILERATTAALIAEVNDAPGRYRFVHGLIAHTLAHELSTARRQRLHGRILEALEESGAFEQGRVAELAHHAAAAIKPSDIDRPLRYACAAGDAALAAVAPADAAQWYRQALDLLARAPNRDERRHCELLLSLASAQLPTDPMLAATTLREAGLEAERLNDPTLLTRWALTRLHGWQSSEPADEERLRILHRTLDLVDTSDHAVRARLLASIAEESDPADWRHRRELADTALAEAAAAGDDESELYVHISTRFIQGPDNAAQAMTTARHAVQVAEAIGDPMPTSGALMHLIDVSAQVGDDETAETARTRLRALERDLATPPLIHGVAMLEVQTAMERGDLDALERHAERLLQIGLTGYSTSLATYGGSLFELRWAQGRLGEAAEMFVAAIDDMPSYAGYRPALVTVYYETGRLDAARDVFTVDAASDFDTFPYDQVWLSCMALYAEATIALHDRHAATVLYDRLLPFADLFAASGPIYYGITRRPLGRLAHFLGRGEDAEHHLRVALNINRQRDARYWLARTALDLAEVLVDRHDTAQEVMTLTNEAIGLATAGGYAAELKRAEDLQRR